MEHSNPRANLAKLIRDNGDDFASLSRLLGKNPAYIQQYIKRGTPKKLDEEDRRKLADFYSVDERLLGAGAPSQAQRRSPRGLISIPQLEIGASAGPGALTDDESDGQTIAFAPQWLKRLGTDPGKLSMISVKGDSMDPALCDGDDIMVDHRAAEEPLRDGIYVIRMDDVLLVKRLAPGPNRTLAVRSDNPQYPDWEDVSADSVTVIGRVIWTGRRL